MRRSIFPADDALPTWLHGVSLLVVVSPIGVPLIWLGVEAIVRRHLDPVSGPEFGQYFFGRASLDGRRAVLAGLSLVAFGSAFFALAASFMRAARGRLAVRLSPWLLLAAAVVLGWLATPHG